MPLTRRLFLGSTLAASVLSALPTRAEEAKPVPARKIKVGLIGCGGRGMWLTNLFNKHGGYEFHAVADYFPDVADKAGEALKVDKARRFSGLDGYKKLLDSGVEAVIQVLSTDTSKNQFWLTRMDAPSWLDAPKLRSLLIVVGVPPPGFVMAVSAAEPWLP